MLDLRGVGTGSLVVLATACSATAPRAASPGSAAAGDPGDAAWAPSGAHMFAQGVISAGDAIQPTFTRDGRTVYFVKTGHLRAHTRIMTARLDRGAWTAPEPAPFGDAEATEFSPFVAPDGAIYFASTRPRAPGDTRSDLDLWVMRPTPSGFAPPQHLGAPIESPEIEVAPSVTRDGTLYFTSGRTQPPGIYRAARQGDGYAEPERLPASINRPDGYTSTPFIAPDDSYLLFYFQPVTPAGIGKAHLHVSWRQSGGWS